MFGNMGKMMKIAGEMKTRLPEVQERIGNSEFTAEAGGVVTATVNGRMKLISVKISPEALADEATDAEMIEDLIVAAVSGAQEQAAEAMREAMRELTGGMDIPGLTDAL